MEALTCFNAKYLHVCFILFKNGRGKKFEFLKHSKMCMKYKNIKTKRLVQV